MVLFKRKPVQYLPRPTIEDDNSEVWVIPETSEVFTSYEPFLQRMDFYKQRRFICEITGHSALTFFEALRSETEGSREVNNAFPEPLREPILRRIQFSTVSRIDNLVDEVYEDFKQDFYPGEYVTVLLTDGSRLHGLVREKANFAERIDVNGNIERYPFASYRVTILNQANEEALLDQDHLTRDRKTFTKMMLRSFIKNTVTREPWNGAPWLVKPDIAIQYHIDTDVPPHLQYGNKVAEKKAMKKGEQEGFFGFFASQHLPELKPAVKGQKAKYTPQELAKAKQDQYLEYQRSLTGNPSFGLSKNGSGKSLPSKICTGPTVVVRTMTPKPPPPPPIKYPIEDLDIEPTKDGSHRPPLKFLTNPKSAEGDAEDSKDEGPEIKCESVGLLLETWNTLNVYCEVYQLDSFTFDDFLQAMSFHTIDNNCELFVEIHCGVLKKLVNPQHDQNGSIQVPLPELPEEESEDESEEESESEPTPEPEPTRRTTRSSLAKAEAENLKEQENRSRSATVETKVHRAAEMFGDYGWIERLRKRDFKNGGWELVMVGLLHRLSHRPRLQSVCDQILSHLAPLDAEPTIETAAIQYSTLDINLRIEALQIICMLSLETKAIKNYLEECSIQMTEFRKEKIEHQRARKAALEELRKLHDERKILQPEPEKSPSPVPELDNLNDSKMTGLDEDSEQVDSEDDEPRPARSLRGGNDRALERKRRQDEERERKEQIAKQPKGSKQYQRVLKKIDAEKAKIKSCEDEIAIVDNDLREADCPRTRVLGKDRFWNRYYWFERNGMPYEGLPTSSTAQANYANGRLWVQGPDEMEREGFIDLPEEPKNEYIKKFQMTVAERKKNEEGSTSVLNARQWGYYDDPESLEKLLGWLDSRGNREVKLRKELQLQKDAITKYMKNRQQYLDQNAERAESEEPTRMSTRTKTYTDGQSHRCLKWKNGTALKENGHLHIDAERPPKRARRGESAKEVKVSNQGKTLSRQGTRYNF
ncbi:hypothetical protein FQN54_007958 [Arachnomyces sp. PD_36]|nr:hypothetical protein FQN54_007958 [Arachnomyces sp. PD_36]